MKKRVLMLLMAALFVLAGCSRPGSTSESGFLGKQKTAVLYFANKEGTDLIAVNLDVEKKDAKDIPGYVLEMLLAGPTDPDLKPVVRAGTKLLDISVSSGLASVDLSREFYNEESIYDVLATASVVKSLCSVRGIDRVLLTVEGTPLQNAAGEEQGVLKESDVVFDADALMQDESNVTLYFSDLNAENLVREIRRIKVPRGDSMEKLVLAELIAGPKDQNATRTIPAETKILSVETKDKVCFVNLSSGFVPKNAMGTAAERMTIFSIVNSLTELSNIDKVQFLIEGEKKEVYHHMIFNEPIERDISMIQK
ncbi:MAG: hypothetical protein E7414_03185 [Ruminococcaceae bacterium]|nr:hypothetical protein [Oscillospiraceae bacterium]